MTTRPEFKEGQYNIECALCGCIKKSSEIRLGEESGLPICSDHAIENGIRPIINIPHAVVPQPSGEPTDKFTTYSTPDE